MNGLASTFDDTEWKVVRSDRGRRTYQNVPNTAVTIVDFNQATAALPPGFGYLEDLLDELEAASDLKEDLAAARREIADQLDRDVAGLARLRMAQGLSQAELAAKLGTSQAAVSRIECGQQDPKLSTLRKMSEVLETDLHTLDGALPR